VTSNPDAAFALSLAQRLTSDLAEYARAAAKPGAQAEAAFPLAPDDQPLVEYDRRITDADLRLATRSRYVSSHYADAVEAGVKALNEIVRARSGSSLDGDPLMTSVFSEKSPKLRLNRLRSDSDRSQQRGHMMMCQAVVAAWRNPRAHSSKVEDSPSATVRMLEHIQHLIEVTNHATRTRTPRKP
jgi:uncharacterized protein (TIGR02391 family)